MANATSASNDLAHPATHAIKDMVNGIWYEDRAGSSTTTQEFIERSTFQVLHLPVELQVKVADQISRYSDLKAFLLTSEKLFDVATPCLYKCVDPISASYDRFRMSEKDVDEQLSLKIKSLLI